MAECDHTPPRSAPATLGNFDEALSEAQTIGSIIGHLALAEIGGHGKVDASMFDWLASELGARLERVEVAGNMLMRRACT